MRLLLAIITVSLWTGFACASNRITQEHFGLWLNLWIQTIDELFEGDYAENAKSKARKMATFMYLKVFESRQNQTK